MFLASFIPEGPGLLLVASGHVDLRQVHEASAALRNRDIVFAIADFQDITELEVTTDELRGLAEHDILVNEIAPKHVAIAIIAPRDDIYGMARMWEVFVEGTGWRTGVFRSRREAHAWVQRVTGATVVWADLPD